MSLRATDTIVYLTEKEWHKCWKEMVKWFGRVPAWDQYHKFLECDYCDGWIDDNGGDGIMVAFGNPADAVAFKLRWV